jgi:hypothetical protein
MVALLILMGFSAGLDPLRLKVWDFAPPPYLSDLEMD